MAQLYDNSTFICLNLYIIDIKYKHESTAASQNRTTYKVAISPPTNEKKVKEKINLQMSRLPSLPIS